MHILPPIPGGIGTHGMAIIAHIDRLTALIEMNRGTPPAEEWSRVRTGRQAELVVYLLSQHPPLIDAEYILEKCGFVDAATARAADLAELHAHLASLKDEVRRLKIPRASS